MNLNEVQQQIMEERLPPCVGCGYPDHAVQWSGLQAGVIHVICPHCGRVERVIQE